MSLITIIILPLSVEWFSFLFSFFSITKKMRWLFIFATRKPCIAIGWMLEARQSPGIHRCNYLLVCGLCDPLFINIDFAYAIITFDFLIRLFINTDFASAIITWYVWCGRFIHELPCNRRVLEVLLFVWILVYTAFTLTPWSLFQLERFLCPIQTCLLRIQVKFEL